MAAARHPWDVRDDHIQTPPPPETLRSSSDAHIQTLPPLKKCPRSNRQLRLGKAGDIDEGRERNRYVDDARKRHRYTCGPPGERTMMCGLSAVAAVFANFSFGGLTSVDDATAAAARPQSPGPAAEVWISPMNPGPGPQNLTREAACMVKEQREQLRAVSDMIFAYLDQDNDGLLSRGEMSRLALITTGVEPPEEEWLDLCTDVGTMCHRGLSSNHFFKVVLKASNDQSLDDLLRMVRAADRDPRFKRHIRGLSALDPAALRPDVLAFGDVLATPRAEHQNSDGPATWRTKDWS